jgi:mannose-1-phosphate guanylyltransferase/mannose-6-phosphate isomerase
MKSIILAGGNGTRLWPLSKGATPKQFLSFGEEESLLRKTLNRVGKLSLPQDIAILTSGILGEKMQKEFEESLFNQILIEPAMRNTAPAIALGISFFLQKGAALSDICLVAPSDHLISPESHFFSDMKIAEAMVREGNIVSFGILPTRAERGFGYLKKGEQIKEGVFQVDQFVEKPSLESAAEFLKSGQFFWNAGIYLFTIGTFLSLLEQFAPQIYVLIQKGFSELLSSFEEMPNISIDYAIMEKVKDLIVIPLSASWYDVGSWDQVYDFLPKDESRNAILGNFSGIDTKSCLILGGKRLIATIGLEDFLVIETEDALLIAKRGESQKVKELVQRLEKK